MTTILKRIVIEQIWTREPVAIEPQRHIVPKQVDRSIHRVSHRATNRRVRNEI